jgi:hypothetical protein
MKLVDRLLTGLGVLILALVALRLLAGGLSWYKERGELAVNTAKCFNPDGGTTKYTFKQATPVDNQWVFITDGEQRFVPGPCEVRRGTPVGS